MKRVVFHRLAASEQINSAVFYERRRPGLGEELLLAIESAIALIQKRPLLGAIGKYGERSRRVDRFPFRIIYDLQPDRIWIVAVAHLSRRPDYWVRRLKTP